MRPDALFGWSVAAQQKGGSRAVRDRPGGDVVPVIEDDRAVLLGRHNAARVSVKTLRRWRWAGCGPRFIKLGRAVRYDLDDIALFIDSGRRLSTSGHGAGEA